MSVTSSTTKNDLADLQRIIEQVPVLRAEVAALQKQREDLGRFLEIDTERAELERLRQEKATILSEARAEASRIVQEAHAATEDLRRSLDERQTALAAQASALEKREKAIERQRGRFLTALNNLDL